MTAYLQQLAGSGRYPHLSEMARVIVEGRDLNADESFVQAW
jgi:hypothetical protein